jgi:4-diphosphocytidyl-2-C-methyl-D-erythritol kinase
LLELSPLPQRDVLLVTPDFQVATPDAYSWIDADRAAGTDRNHQEALEPSLITGEMLATWTSMARLSRNDFIDSVAGRHPRLRPLLDALKESGSLLCSMTGAGSTLFGIYDKLPHADALRAFRDTKTDSTRTADKVVQPIRTG